MLGDIKDRSLVGRGFGVDFRIGFGSNSIPADLDGVGGGVGCGEQTNDWNILMEEVQMRHCTMHHGVEVE